jgi:hypothetical protein
MAHPSLQQDRRNINSDHPALPPIHPQRQRSHGDHVIVVGRVVAASAEEGVLVEDRRDLVTAPPLLHLGGNHFTTTSGEVSEPNVGLD